MLLCQISLLATNHLAYHVRNVEQ